MDIKQNLFVTDIKYSYYNQPTDENKPSEILEIDKIENLSNDDCVILLQFKIIGLEKLNNMISERDGIAVLTYSKLYSNELRFEGMRAAGVKYPKGLITDFGMAINSPYTIDDIENMYIKVLYIPNALSSTENNSYPFYYMTNETEEELAKLSFPIKLFKGGKI